MVSKTLDARYMPKHKSDKPASNFLTVIGALSNLKFAKNTKIIYEDNTLNKEFHSLQGPAFQMYPLLLQKQINPDEKANKIIIIIFYILPILILNSLT